MTQVSTYPLRLPKSVKTAAEQAARDEGISLNQFVATAVAEKLSALNTARFFTERRERADLQALRTLLTRSAGTEPRLGDELQVTRPQRKWKGHTGRRSSG